MRTFSIIFLLFVPVLLVHAQTKDLTSENLISYQGKLHDGEGNILNGEYKITEAYDGSYLTASFIDGFEQGATSAFSSEDVLISKADVFYNIIIGSEIFDEKGKIIENNKLFEIKILGGKKNKKRSISSGRVKLVGDGQYYLFTIKNGQLEGLFEFYEKGKESFKSRYSAGILTENIEYNTDGVLTSESIYCDVDLATDLRMQIDSWDTKIEEVENGIYIWKDANGKPLNGEYLIVMDGFKVTREGSFENGKYSGVILTYDEDGRLNKKSNYVKGKYEGLTIEYGYSSIEKTHYRNGLKHGLFTRYDFDSGLILDSVNYVNDVMDGVQQKRWTGGEHAKYNYVKGKLHGKVETYYKFENGTDYLQSIEYYVYGAKNGLFIEYDSLGNLVSEEKYKFDKLNGNSNYYDSGRITSTSVFRMGKNVQSTFFDNDGNKESESVLEEDKWVSTSYYESGTIKSINYSPSKDMRVNGAIDHTKEYDPEGNLVIEVIETFNEHKIIKEYVNEVLKKESTSPYFTDESSIRKIDYYNKKGQISKTCQSTYDENGGKYGYGAWRKEVCD